MAVVTRELMWRLRGAEHAYNKRLLTTWASLPGNPRGAGFSERPWGTLFHSAANPGNSIFNHAGCLSGHMLEALDEIETDYGELGIPPTVETSGCELPEKLTDGPFSEMIRRGYKPHQIEGLYFGEADRHYAPASKDVEIVRVSTPEQTKSFLELYLTGWDYPEDVARLWRQIGGQMAVDPNYSAYIACVDGKTQDVHSFTTTKVWDTWLMRVSYQSFVAVAVSVHYLR